MATTPLQTILRQTYFAAFKRRNDAAHEVNICIHRLEAARRELDVAQNWIEAVGAELKASGYERADDYLARVWPVARPTERSSGPHEAVAE